MKISKQTLDVLANFATVNQNILVKPGNKLSTININKTQFVNAVVEDQFETEFGLYNLAEFIGVLSLFKDPDVQFGDRSARITEGKQSVNYFYADRSVLVLPPEKEFKMPSVEASFTLSEEQIKSLKNAARQLSSTDLFFVGKDGVISAIVGDPGNPTANTFSIEVGATDHTFNTFVKIESLKMLPGNYDVQLSKARVSRFNLQNGSYEMIIALDAKSTFA